MPDFSTLLNATGTRWKCGHARHAPLAKLTWSKLMLEVTDRRVRRDDAEWEVTEREHECHGCRRARKRSCKFIAGHVALALLQLVFALLCLFESGALR